jgi:hypothetical protein
MTNDELPDNLARTLKVLEADAARAAARLDATRVAAGVLDRLRAEPVVTEAPARRWHGGALRIAAAAVVLVIGGMVAQRLGFTPVGGGRELAGLPMSVSADSMDEREATELLNAVEQVGAAPAGAADTAATANRAVSVDDLSEAELRTLLRIMESSEESK